MAIKQSCLRFDTNLIKIGASNDYFVRYYVYKSNSKDIVIPDNPEKEINAVRNNNIYCFAGLSSLLKHSSDKYNRLVYLLRFSKNNTNRYPMCNLSERKEWIKICVENKALPDYILKSDIINNKYVFKLDNSISPSLLYVYLSNIRNIIEHPDFVRNMITLVRKYKIPFTLSYLFASRISHNNSGHNIIPVGRNYCIMPEDINDIKDLDISISLALKKYLDNPSKFDKRSIFEGFIWNIHNIIKSASSIYVSATDLFDDKIQKLFK